MKAFQKIAYILIYLLGVFMIIMSLDCFDLDNSFWKLIVCFIINSSPGIIIILVNYLLRKKQFILGVILLLASIGFFILFKFYKDIDEKIITIIIVEAPVLFSAVVFLLTNKKKR